MPLDAVPGRDEDVDGLAAVRGRSAAEPERVVGRSELLMLDKGGWVTFECRAGSDNESTDTITWPVGVPISL